MASYVLVKKVDGIYSIVQNIPVGFWLVAPGNSIPDTRLIYGDKVYAGDNGTADTMGTYVLMRTNGGYWFMDYANSGLQNINNEDLEFRTFSHYEDEYFETGKFKELTVIRTNYYIDSPLDEVKEQLKNMLISEKDMRINVPYTFKSKDKKVTLEFNMSNDARYNIRDAYYLQQDMKSSDVAFFIENTPIRLPKKYIQELFMSVNEFIYNILVELQRQIFNVESTDTIYEAQVAAEWVYANRDIPERIFS